MFYLHYLILRFLFRFGNVYYLYFIYVLKLYKNTVEKTRSPESSLHRIACIYTDY